VIAVTTTRSEDAADRVERFKCAYTLNAIPNVLCTNLISTGYLCPLSRFVY
jgi:hypothetical protein